MQTLKTSFDNWNRWTVCCSLQQCIIEMADRRRFLFHRGPLGFNLLTLWDTNQRQDPTLIGAQPQSTNLVSQDGGGQLEAVGHQDPPDLSLDPHPPQARGFMRITTIDMCQLLMMFCIHENHHVRLIFWNLSRTSFTGTLTCADNIYNSWPTKEFFFMVLVAFSKMAKLFVFMLNGIAWSLEVAPWTKFSLISWGFEIYFDKI